MRTKLKRLTTEEEHPHGAEGISADKLTGNFCRGVYEATAVTERLAEYENTGLTPEQITRLRDEVDYWKRKYEEVVDAFLEFDS